MRARTLILTVLLVLLGAPGESARAQAPGGPRFVVIVNTENGATSLGRQFVADAFFKKTTRWGSGRAIRPVDQRADSRTRQAFSAKVLGRSVSAVKSYWQQIIFSGRGLPPPELDGDEDVVRYVRKHAGAIGYVSPEADVTGVTVVSVR